MQLVEFFIWRNINTIYNSFFSTIACILIFIQPIFSLMVLPNRLRRNLIIAYSLIFVPYFTYKFMTNHMKSQISNGHLVWLFFDTNLLLYLLWLFFFLFSFIYRNNIFGFIFAIVLFCICYYNYYKDKTISSMWCWISNSSMICFAIY